MSSRCHHLVDHPLCIDASTRAPFTCVHMFWRAFKMMSSLMHFPHRFLSVSINVSRCTRVLSWPELSCRWLVMKYSLYSRTLSVPVETLSIGKYYRVHLQSDCCCSSYFFCCIWMNDVYSYTTNKWRLF